VKLGQSEFVRLRCCRLLAAFAFQNTEQLGEFGFPPLQRRLELSRSASVDAMMFRCPSMSCLSASHSASSRSA
jgi:hypothetical protein